MKQHTRTCTIDIDWQYPLGLRVYITRCLGGSSSHDQVFWDPETGEEYWPIARAAQELGNNKTTIRRWIAEERLSAQLFTYQVRSGMQKAVQAVARTDIERLKEQQKCKEQAITLIEKSHQITEAPAQRHYTRLHTRLQKRLGREPKPGEILQALRDDPKLVAYHQRWSARRSSGKARESIERPR